MSTRKSQTILIFLIAISISVFGLQSSIEQQPSFDYHNRFPFERTIWTYWSSPNGQIPLVVQICFDNIEKAAKKNNFTFICLNETSVRSYIPNYDQDFVQTRKNSVQNTAAHAADLLRILLIAEQGGIWVDSTTLFINGLDELENIMSDKYEHIITNRFSPEPDTMLFYYSLGQNRIERWVEDPYNASREILYNEYPNFEIWMIAAKKKSPFIQQLKKTYMAWTVTQYNEVQSKLIKEDIYMHRIDESGSYLYLNMAVSYVLQAKQKQLDQHTSILGKRQSVFEHYKLWGLHAQYGPMMTIRQDLSPISDLMEYSIQEFEERGFKFLFFMKQFGYFRYLMGKYLDIMIDIYETKNMNFESFLLSNPDRPWCENVTWLVEGSIMDQMIRNSKVTEKHKFPTITREQNIRWHEYCSANGSLLSHINKFYTTLGLQTIILSIFMPDKIIKSKVNSILNDGKELSIVQRLMIFYDDNTFLLFQFFYVMTLFSIFWLSYKKLLPLFKTHIKKSCQKLEPARQPVSLHESHRLQDLQVPRSPLSLKSDESHSKFNLKQTRLISCLMFALIVFTLSFYNAVDVLGGLDQQFTIFLFILSVFIVQAYLENIFRKKDRKLIKLKYGYELFYMTVNFIIAYLALCHARKNRFWLNSYSIVLGMVGPCIFKLKRQIHALQTINDQQQGLKDFESESFLSLKRNKLRYLTITLLSSGLIFPNLEYMAGPYGYYINYVPTILTILLSIVCIWVFLKCLVHRLWLEAYRIIILVLICYSHVIIEASAQYIIHVHPRMVFVYLRVTVITIIYLSIGSSIKFANIQKVYFNSSRIKTVLVYFGVLLIECIFGRLFSIKGRIYWTKMEFIEHWVLFAYGVFMAALFSHFEQCSYVSKTHSDINEEEYTEVQMDNESD